MFLANLLGWILKETIGEFLTGFLLFLDALVYSLINWVYQIILALCETNILENSYQIDALISRIYMIIGVIVMFLLAYSLLKSMVNPDEAFKGKKSPVALIKDVLISIVLIALIPTIFDFALGFQNALLTQNTIGSLILGSTNESTGDDSSELIASGGRIMAAGVLEAFLHPNYSNSDACTPSPSELSGYDCSKLEIDGVAYLGVSNKMKYKDFWENVKDNGNFMAITSLADSIVKGKTTYYWVISTIGGVFVLFVLITYCFEIALRVIKLAICELIAPLPILARILPNEQGNKVFNNWLKATLSIYAEVFIRLAVLFFSVLLIKIVINNFPSMIVPKFGGSASFTVALFAQLFIIIGIIMFIKQAPEIIKEITGLDGGKYNPLKAAKQGFSLLAGGIAGGSPLAAFRAWEQAGQAKNMLDFSAIGNQYKRKLAKQDAKDQNAKWRDRAGDSVRKAFGWETKLERSNRRIDKGLDLKGKQQEFINDTEGNIVLTDANGNTITIKPGDKIQMSEAMQTMLQNKKDVNAIDMSKIEEQKRQTTEGQALNKQHFDTWSNMKREADDKMADGNNDVFGGFYEVEKVLGADGGYHWQYKYDANGDRIALKGLNGEDLTDMNYATLEKYVKDNGDKVSPQVLAEWQANLKMAHDEIRDRFLSREAAAHRGRTSELTTQFLVNYKENGIFDAATGEQFWLDFGGDIGTDVDKLVAAGRMSEIFTLKNGVKRVKKDGSAYREEGTRSEGAGMDLTIKHQNDLIGGILQDFQNKKSKFEDETKRIDRMSKQLEEAKTELKSSPDYARYKASDTANKIDDSGKK